jgi:hypothetical protein
MVFPLNSESGDLVPMWQVRQQAILQRIARGMRQCLAMGDQPQAGKRLCKCLVSTDVVVAIDKCRRKPSKKYIILCREAAYHVSREFGQY